MNTINEKSYDEVVNQLKERGIETDEEIINGSFVKIPEGNDNDQLLFDGMKYGISELINRWNSKSLTISKEADCGNNALMQTIGEIPEFKNNTTPRYDWIKHLKTNYDIEKGNIGAKKLEIFDNIASSFVSFISSLHWQKARTNMDLEEHENQNIVNKIKDAF